MYKDYVVDEVRKTQENILEKFDYDLKKYIDYIIEKQNENKYRLITNPFEKEVVSIS
jgi:hypothetical protein